MLSVDRSPEAAEDVDFQDEDEVFRILTAPPRHSIRFNDNFVISFQAPSQRRRSARLNKNNPGVQKTHNEHGRVDTRSSIPKIVIPPLTRFENPSPSPPSPRLHNPPNAPNGPVYSATPSDSSAESDTFAHHFTPQQHTPPSPLSKSRPTCLLATPHQPTLFRPLTHQNLVLPSSTFVLVPARFQSGDAAEHPFEHPLDQLTSTQPDLGSPSIRATEGQNTQRRSTRIKTRSFKSSRPSLLPPSSPPSSRWTVRSTVKVAEKRGLSRSTRNLNITPLTKSLSSSRSPSPSRVLPSSLTPPPRSSPLVAISPAQVTNGNPPPSPTPPPSLPTSTPQSSRFSTDTDVSPSSKRTDDTAIPRRTRGIRLDYRALHTGVGKP